MTHLPQRCKFLGLRGGPASANSVAHVKKPSDSLRHHHRDGRPEAFPGTAETTKAAQPAGAERLRQQADLQCRLTAAERDRRHHRGEAAAG